MTSILSVTLFQYFVKHQDDPNPKQKNGWKIPKSVNLGMPFSLRQPAKTLADMKLNNDFAAIPVNIGVHEHFSDAIEGIKKSFKKLRTSMMPYGVLNMFYITISFPFILPKFAVDFLSDKYTLIFSNLNASRIKYSFNGQK